MLLDHNELISYKKINLNSQGKLEFFLQKHSTKAGVWGMISITSGEVDFVFLNGQEQELSRHRLSEKHPPLSIPPAIWHKIIPVSTTFNADLEFYCSPQNYFKKKYNLGVAHQDVVFIYQTFLRKLGHLKILDVGCGSGRNTLYLAKMGHQVTGIDHNQSALKTIKDIAQKEDLSTVETLSHDLNQPLNIEPDYYDLVISTVTLQFLNPERIPDLLVEIQNTTKMNGYHLLVFPVQSKLYSLPDSFIYLPKKEEIYHAYQDSGCSILEYKESVGHLHKQDDLGRPIQGLFGFLLAKKIG